MNFFDNCGHEIIGRDTFFNATLRKMQLMFHKPFEYTNISGVIKQRKQEDVFCEDVY